ncbi:MAG: hypothetical protein IJD78_01335 [Clostridia bacterium]|nr:hypothetical protein [Clostridia bacterium]
MKRKVLSIILCMTIILTAIPFYAFAEETRAVVDSGFCGAHGENLTWTLFDDGEIVISGEGEMKLYHINSNTLEVSSPLIPPWYDYFADIRVITVEEGVTGIGDDAFYVSPRPYHRVNLPKSLEYYYTGAFTSSDCADGSDLVCCYAGTSEEAREVEQRSWSGIHLNDDLTEVVEIRHRNPIYGIGLGYGRYFEGAEPEPYCIIKKVNSTGGSKLEKGETAELYIRYYSGDNTGAKLAWKTEGDGCSIEYTKHSESGVQIKAKITSVTHGDFSVIAEIIDADGTVLCSDRKDYKSYVPEDMTPEEKKQEEREKLRKTFETTLAEMQLLGFFTVFMVGGMIAEIPLIPYYIYLAFEWIIDELF